MLLQVRVVVRAHVEGRYFPSRWQVQSAVHYSAFLRRPLGTQTQSASRCCAGASVSFSYMRVGHSGPSRVFSGAPLYGVLPPCGIGVLAAAPEVPDLDGIWHECYACNQELLGSLREDENAAVLHQIAVDDARLGRMTPPTPASEVDLATVIGVACECGLLAPLRTWCQVRLAPRFAVVQGVKPDGSAKVRAVDHMSWSAAGRKRRKRSRMEVKKASVNGSCSVPERVAHDHLDDLAATMHAFFLLFGVLPALWKADIDAAFRRIPLVREHVSAAGVAWLFDNIAWVSCHLAMPFGAASSVWAWHRLGALICTIARVILHLPVMRYVDDYFAVERHSPPCPCTHFLVAHCVGVDRRQGEAEHAMWCFARLVRLLLGETSVADKKLEFGDQLLVLGMQVTLASRSVRLWGHVCYLYLQVIPRPKGIYFVLDAAKARKWILDIDAALRVGKLTSGESQKLAGRLMWATQHLFYRCTCICSFTHVRRFLLVCRIGRAMIKAIYEQKRSHDGAISVRLRTALLWWRNVLSQKISEVSPWVGSSKPPCRLLVDAASTPPCCAAILFIDSTIRYTVWSPPAALLAKLVARQDNQIGSLEILAILLALSTFRVDLEGRKVVLYSDNVGAEKGTARGSARAWDHNRLVHQIWTVAINCRIKLWVERVPSKENLADCPSRGSVALLRDLGATWIEPYMEASLLDGAPGTCELAGLQGSQDC